METNSPLLGGREGGGGEKSKKKNADIDLEDIPAEFRLVQVSRMICFSAPLASFGELCFGNVLKSYVP